MTGQMMANIPIHMLCTSVTKGIILWYILAVVAVITTFVCDVTGVQSQDKSQFVDITITAAGYSEYNRGSGVYSSGLGEKVTSKFVHKDVANKLCLLELPKSAEAVPEPTFESKLQTLLADYINELVYEEVSSQISNRN